MVSASYEILTSLPPYGPVAEPFSATGQGTHREGFVVRFLLTDGTTWVGNFQPSFAGTSGVFACPDGRRFLVVAKGQGYIVDPNNRGYRHYIGGQIEDAILVPEIPELVITNGLWLEALGNAGILWKTSRLSWDGMQNIQVHFPNLAGEAWSPLDDTWSRFNVDLITGRSSGGSYGGPGGAG